MFTGYYGSGYDTRYRRVWGGGVLYAADTPAAPQVAGMVVSYRHESTHGSTNKAYVPISNPGRTASSSSSPGLRPMLSTFAEFAVYLWVRREPTPGMSFNSD